MGGRDKIAAVKLFRQPVFDCSVNRCSCFYSPLPAILYTNVAVVIKIRDSRHVKSVRFHGTIHTPLVHVVECVNCEHIQVLAIFGETKNWCAAVSQFRKQGRIQTGNRAPPPQE